MALVELPGNLLVAGRYEVLVTPQATLKRGPEHQCGQDE